MSSWDDMPPPSAGLAPDPQADAEPQSSSPQSSSPQGRADDATNRHSGFDEIDPYDGAADSQRYSHHGEVPTIRVRHLWHRFGAFDVLRDVNFEVWPGEIYGFIGPNGAGKTTTIRVMATLLEPMAGRVEIDGVDVTVRPEAVRRTIGYMPDHAGVYERVTVREYLEFFADAFQVGSPNVVDAVLELTDLKRLHDRLVVAMSKGMKQRLQLARTLLHDPKVLILDEPASDLDPRARIEIRDLLVELRSLGKTIFLSSHILTELSDVCDSVGILERGRLLVSGPIDEIGSRLEAQRAAQMIGHTVPGLPGAAATVAVPGNFMGGPYPATGQAPTHPAAAAPVDPNAANPPPQRGLGPVAYRGHLPPPGTVGPVYGPARPVIHGGPPPGAAPQAGVPYGAVPPGAAPPYGPMPYAHHHQAVQGPGMSLAARKVKLKVLGNPNAAAHALRGGPGIEEVEVMGPTLIVSFLGNETKIAEIVAQLCRHHIGVVGVEQERNELERIFLEVTRGDLQ